MAFSQKRNFRDRMGKGIDPLDLKFEFGNLGYSMDIELKSDS